VLTTVLFHIPSIPATPVERLEKVHCLASKL
jgi:hypothetical protein